MLFSHPTHTMHYQHSPRSAKLWWEECAKHKILSTAISFFTLSYPRILPGIEMICSFQICRLKQLPCHVQARYLKSQQCGCEGKHNIQRNFNLPRLLWLSSLNDRQPSLSVTAATSVRHPKIWYGFSACLAPPTTSIAKTTNKPPS